MMLIAVDPGPVESAYVHMPARAPTDCFAVARILPDADMRDFLELNTGPETVVVIEMIASYGMPVGAEVFKTCLDIGRFVESCHCPVHLLPRIEVKSAICHSGKATDANIRQALIDRYGGKERAIGNKKSPGPLYGVKADMWAALAVACAFTDGARWQWAEGKEPTNV